MKDCPKLLYLFFATSIFLNGCSKEAASPEEPEIVVINDPTVGCTDELAKNYKATASTEDCSCEYNFDSKVSKTTPTTFLRRALVEEHGGTWCGWCPMSKEVMEDLILNPQVIGVEVHFNDEMMALDDIYTPLKKKYGNPAFPSGMVNRRKSVIGTTTIMSHEDWKINVEEWLKKGNSPVGLALEAKLANGEISVLTHFKTTEKVDEELRIGIYLVENNVAGHPQLNYLSNYQQFKKWRAFSKPAEIADILHYNVGRSAISPITDGLKIPAAALQQSKVFRKLFSAKLPPSVKVSGNCSVVAFVMNNNLEILTSREVKVNSVSDWE